MSKESAGSVKARQNKHNERVTRGKKYVPDQAPRGFRNTNSDVRVICPKTGEVLEVIENNPFKQSEFRDLTIKTMKRYDKETERILENLEENEFMTRVVKWKKVVFCIIFFVF